MILTKKFKEILIDILVRLAQIVFVAFVVTPFISQQFDIPLQLFGVILASSSITCALIISLTIKEVE